MKRVIILLLGLLWAAGAFAQYVPEWHQGDLKKKGTVLALQGMKLDRATTDAILNQVGGSEMVDSWNKYCRERGWGIGLTAGGFTLAAAGLGFGGVYFVAGVVGTIFAAIGGQEAVDKLWADLGPRVYIGGAAMLAGLAAGTTGIVLLSVGNRNLKKLAKTCDAAGLGPQPGVQLAFGPAPSGMGLVLYF
jgi:hypothetical protein